jgi:hypothetical protein
LLATNANAGSGGSPAGPEPYSIALERRRISARRVARQDHPQRPVPAGAGRPDVRGGNAEPGSDQADEYGEHEDRDDVSRVWAPSHAANGSCSPQAAASSARTIRN